MDSVPQKRSFHLPGLSGRRREQTIILLADVIYIKQVLAMTALSVFLRYLSSRATEDM